ncbi:MAG: Asp-tRNA(Asn)/Glu-tRNA(Gln) amidotransferase subunit GatB [Candidatus Sungbacteria bacterium]|nr:Asp-tRNA(Asn)/Glu-tRNA(Gln) amidotransferase subunit GatB [Candidatus Sungbacteria bacterium]
MEYEPVIGLEVHTELKTRTKMFCDSLNDPDEKHPNVNICPICLGHPGTLPTINKTAVEKVILVGMALSAEIPEFSQFDRKNYFYPDLPKGYQISQYQHPFVKGGYLEFTTSSGVRHIRITRVHLEEDTGRLIHVSRTMNSESRDKDSSFKVQDVSLVDFNRSGVPLMELVTEPDMRSSEEARRFAEELQLIIRYVGASDADMEKGQMRVEANVSLRLKGTKELGTKVELKNINSFKFVEKAIEYEIKRQTEVLARGERVVQETRGWDDTRGVTVSQRLKEGATDYRYFPEPDLPPLVLDQAWIREIRAKLPELPKEKRARFAAEYGLDEKTVELFVRDAALSGYFESVISELEVWITSKVGSVDRPRAIKLVANYLTVDFQKLLNETLSPVKDVLVTPENFAELITYVYEGSVSSTAAKETLTEMFKTGKEPDVVIQERGLAQESSREALGDVIRRVIQENSAIVESVKQGKGSALQALVGAAMKASGGKGNPMVLREMLEEALGKESA